MKRQVFFGAMVGFTGVVALVWLLGRPPAARSTEAVPTPAAEEASPAALPVRTTLTPNQAPRPFRGMGALPLKAPVGPGPGLQDAGI